MLYVSSANRTAGRPPATTTADACLRHLQHRYAPSDAGGRAR
ncbi:hypothetical protein [Streptomyces sp. NBC_00091]|nr:hypothetical protein [Streptomyces sp. NBC_00091]MCX5380304.1 hypothetical protein [Streptomyces sp. NBC_00091]